MIIKSTLLPSLFLFLFSSPPFLLIFSFCFPLFFPFFYYSFISFSLFFVFYSTGLRVIFTIIFTITHSPSMGRKDFNRFLILRTPLFFLLVFIALWYVRFFFNGTYTFSVLCLIIVFFK